MNFASNMQYVTCPTFTRACDSWCYSVRVLNQSIRIKIARLGTDQLLLAL